MSDDDRVSNFDAIPKMSSPLPTFHISGHRSSTGSCASATSFRATKSEKYVNGFVQYQRSLLIPQNASSIFSEQSRREISVRENCEVSHHSNSGIMIGSFSGLPPTFEVRSTQRY
jgi:hypothetical protein